MRPLREERDEKKSTSVRRRPPVSTRLAVRLAVKIGQQEEAHPRPSKPLDGDAPELGQFIEEEDRDAKVSLNVP
jgi:hypothetical protein